MLASANPDKAAEIAAILDGFDVELRPSDLGEVVEDGTTLEENALIKARAVSAHTGMAAVADDTGLEVAALDGAPGVYSARFAGENATYRDNVELLLKRLSGATTRQARFRTVAVLCRPDGGVLVAEGVVEGSIAGESRGESGFGYDPVFVPADGDGRTFAEMSAQEKNSISHRGRAFRALAAMLGDSDRGGG